MDTIVENFNAMHITTHQPTHQPTKKIPNPNQIICALYLENKQLRQQLAQLKTLLYSHQPNIPHWVK